MSIWFATPTLAEIERMLPDTLMSHLGITFVEIGPDFLSAKMPVTSAAVQPFRILHGGATAALAETVASMASLLVLNTATHYSVGLTLTINHIRSVPQGGEVTATARAQHLGRSTHVWAVQVQQADGKLVATATLTAAVLANKAS